MGILLLRIKNATALVNNITRYAEFESAGSLTKTYSIYYARPMKIIILSIILGRWSFNGYPYSQAFSTILFYRLIKKKKNNARSMLLVVRPDYCLKPLLETPGKRAKQYR
jgi:hypothetical protein